jgi:hypothetical protein
MQSELAVAFGVRAPFSRGELIRDPGLPMIATSVRPVRRNLRARSSGLSLSRSCLDERRVARDEADHSRGHQGLELDWLATRRRGPLS